MQSRKRTVSSLIRQCRAYGTAFKLLPDGGIEYAGRRCLPEVLLADLQRRECEVAEILRREDEAERVTKMVLDIFPGARVEKRWTDDLR